MSFEYWWHFLGQLKEHQYSLPTEPDLQYDFHSGTERDTSTLEGGVKMIYSSTQVASVINHIWLYQILLRHMIATTLEIMRL